MRQSTTHCITALQIARRFGLKRALTYRLALHREPAAMHAWQVFLEHHITQAQRDGLMLRVLRPYMRQYFTPAQRRALLQEHISVMAHYFLPDARLSAEPGMVVATVHGKNHAIYTLTVGGNTSKEGELAFGIYDAEGHYLAKMAGSIGRDEQGAAVLWIGGLQGAKPPLGRDEVVKATKDLFGLRPKGAVMLVAQTFARELGLTAIRAPGNAGHISQRGLRVYRSKRKIHADYGQFWEELGGHAMAPEEYSIPVTPPMRDVADVKPNKRPEWKKRQALSEALTNDVMDALASIRRN